MATEEKHCLMAVLSVDIARLNAVQNRYTMKVLQGGIVTLTYSNNGVSTKKSYYPSQGQLLEALSKNDNGARDGLSADLRCRYDVLENLRAEIATESMLCQQEATEIARVKQFNPGEATRRRTMLDVRNRTVGARGNELGRQRAVLSKEIEAFKRKSGAAPPAPTHNQVVPAYSIPNPPPTMHQTMAPAPYSPQVAYPLHSPYASYAPAAGPKAAQYPQPAYPIGPAMFQRRNSVQYQYPAMNCQVPVSAPAYGKEQPVLQPAPHPATFLHDPNNSRHRYNQNDPARPQLGCQQPDLSRPEHAYSSEQTRRRHSDYYRPGMERDGDYYRPQYPQQAVPSLPPFQATPLGQGKPAIGNENIAPSTAGQQQLQPPQNVHRDTRLTHQFPNPTVPPSRLDRQFLRPIQNMIRRQEPAKRPTKRKVEEGEEVDGDRVKREKVEKESAIPYPTEPLSYDDLPLYTASPPRPKSGI